MDYILFIKKKINSFLGKESNATSRKITKGLIWTFLGTAISKGFFLLAFVVIARIISVEDYGKIGLLRSFINTFTFFSLASFGVTANKYLAINKENNKILASRIYSSTRLLVFILSLFILLVSVIFLEDITIYVVGDATLKTEVLLSSFAIFFASLNGLQMGALSGLEKFNKISKVHIVNGLLSLPLLCLGAYYKGVLGVIVALLLVNIAIWLCSAFFLHRGLKEFGITFRLDNFGDSIKIVKSFTLPSFLGGVMMSPVILYCNSLLVNYSSDGFEELGFYNAAFLYSSIVSILIGIVGQVFYPFSMKFFNKKNAKFDFVNIFTSYILGIILCFPLLCFPDLFMKIFGEDYEGSTTTLILVVLSTIVIAHRQGIARNFAAGDFMWWSLLSNSFWAVNVIFWCYFFLEDGAVGRAAAFFIAYLINTLVFIPFYIRKKLITRSLVFSKFHLGIISSLFIGVCTFYYLDSIFLRIFLFMGLTSFIILCFYKWFNKYTQYA
ncbi:oligosaccharide flippase family protein [Dokdonia ponticola]|uniref:Oligosaccharide flippase family protein n=1 Tax=Dokdonia ponticola TaxID=2041041 RepID=A0ABV9HT31_9FLAO